MQIVIDIPEYIYEELIEKEYHSTVDFLILDGTPLPKGHGRLIDENQIDAVELEDSITFMRYTKGGEVDLWIDAPTIIEAEAESEEKE